MDAYRKATSVMEELFSRDCQFALATVGEQGPSARYVDLYYQDGCFYLVTWGKSRKMAELRANPRVALCSRKLYRFSGVAEDLGNPLQEANRALHQTLTRVFAPWYHAHNNENDPETRFVKIRLTEGFVWSGGRGYRINFSAGKAEEFPFENPAVLID